MLNGNTNPALLARCERIAHGTSLFVIGLGVVALLGWGFDALTLAGEIKGWVPVRPNTAIAFILSGLSLISAMHRKRASFFRGAHLVLAAVVTLLGAFTSIEYVLSLDLGIDDLFFTVIGSSDEPGVPASRMAFATALAFVFSGLGLALLDTKERMASSVAALVGALIGVLAVMGYTFGVTALYGVGARSSVALPTAIGLVVLNLGILHSRPLRRPISVLNSGTVGGMMARRLFPLALTAPFLIGWLCVEGGKLGLYRMEFGIALLSLIYVVLFAALILHTAEVLRKADQQRLSAEQEQRQQQSQLAGIIDSAMDAIVMLDSEYRIVLFNPAAEHMFGRTAAEVLGSNLDMLMPERFRSTHDGQLRNFAEGLPDRRKGSLGTVSGLRANGEEFPIESSIARVQVDGINYLTAILRDVTDRRRVIEALRESEKRERMRSEDLSTLLDAVPAAVWLALDPQATEIRGNKLLYEWLRLPEGVNVAPFLPYGNGPSDIRLLKNGMDVPLSQMPLQQAAAGIEVRDYEFEFVVGDGTSRHLLGNATPLRDESGQPRGAISAFIDITARHEAELAMKAAKIEAERANNAKSRFLAAASHDLRQPLSALALYTTVLEDRLPEADQSVLGNMRACVSSLSALLTDLLDLSKLEAGVVTPNICSFSVAELLANQASVHAPDAELKGLRLDCKYRDWMVRTDPVLFRRILGNLIDNAIRYTDRGGVLVTCRRRAGKAWIEVWDTGIGIPPDKTSEIFEEFRQLGDEARTRGSGLGLAIVAKTAALLGLGITVRSRLGRGSVFAVELPVTQETMVVEPEHNDFSYRPLGIALVEDNELVREAMASALQSVGHRVLATATGAELCAGLAEFKPDIVVSDYRLGRGETGFDVIKEVRAELKRDLPAILITGDTDPQLMRSMAARGIVVLHKPLDLETLRAYLEDLTYDEAVDPA